MFDFKYQGKFKYPDSVERNEWAITFNSKLVGLISSKDMINAELRSDEQIVLLNEDRVAEEFYSYMEEGLNAPSILDS